MKTISPPEPLLPVEKKKISKVGTGALILSIIVHGSLLLFVGGVVIYQGTVSRSPMTAEVDHSEVVDLDKALLPETEEDKSAAEGPITEMPENTPESPAAGQSVKMEMLSAVVESPSFNISPVNGSSTSLPSLDFGQEGKSQETQSGKGGVGGIGEKIRSIFGQNEAVDAAMKGTLYDLKQKKGGGSVDEIQFLKEFAAKDFKRSMLRDFYEAKTQLFATQIFMPSILADEAPKAFGAGKEVQPRNFVVFYEGQFASPDNATYRFVGQADDVILVRVNGKMVFDGSIYTAMNPGSITGLKPRPEQINMSQRIGDSFPLVYGEWMDLQAGVNNKIEIVLGEVPGGEFNAYLFIQKKGKKYETDPKRGDAPILPIFRTQEAKDDWSQYDPKKIPSYDRRGPIFTPK